MTVRRHPVRQHPRRTAAGVSVVGRHMRGDGTPGGRVPPANRSTPDLATRYIGSCQICEGEHKLDAQLRIVHHGYLRPGDGAIHGDCLGVNEPPYERSCEACRPYLAGVVRRLGDLEEGLRHFRDPSLTTFQRMCPGLRRNDPPITTTYTLGVSHAWEWRDNLRAVIGQLEMARDATAREVIRMERRIAAWTLRPVRSVEELVVREAARRAERESVQTARRAAQEAAEATKRAKREVQDSRRQALIDATKATIRDLARRKAAGENVDREATRMLQKVQSAAFIRVCRYDVGNMLDDVRRDAIAVGVAHTNARGDVVWGYY